MNKYTVLIVLFFAGLIWSGIEPRNYGHWIGEVSPTLIGFAILAATFKKFRFTYFTYLVIILSCYFMFVGGHYTFSRVPLFNWLRDFLGQERNNFDKLGHFIQGVVPVLVSRELFIREKIVAEKWVSFLSFCICLSTTTVYEIVEYLFCLTAGKNPVTFLGTQGYVWDCQSDMLFAALGGLFVLFTLKGFHNQMMQKEFQES
ncbi:MAG: hypothetical protein A2W90_01185 [Bacteroidetes bacterium GWF2_42_66]|nr:MAG: hypothetical protein A2W92_00605 [Bacteroidetes bacterium GWA2_42_15]OFY00993.1 MAG: hypothetical protein A2W89_14675 [Bacteroidetes bacterium GWE2_42_39]OFY41833.1 MAG: hypothetical protein A2W90_01185 [Bacteroidetes bacterium GWF2_42_66]HBL77995.1 DUF2238 domain-containing protein [Prolixibacteraceae bacterium]HCR90242.1 DUF2238 domain-containing protein [Prolixibacteraceae bacterium]